MVNTRKNGCYLCLYNKSEKNITAQSQNGIKSCSLTTTYKIVPTHDGSDSFKLQPTNREHLIIFDTQTIVLRFHKTQKNLLVSYYY